MALPYEELFSCAKKDLPIDTIVKLVYFHKKNPNFRREIIEGPRSPIENIILKFYNAWFYELSLKLELEADPSNSRKKYQPFEQDDTHWPLFILSKISAQVQSACQNVQLVEDDSFIDSCTDVITIYIAPALERCPSLSEIEKSIQRQATIFSNIAEVLTSSNFINAYTIYKKTYENCIKLASIEEAIEKEILNNGLKDVNKILSLLNEVKDFSLYLLPTKTPGYTLFHLICEKGLANQVVVLMLKHIKGHEQQFMRLLRPTKWNPVLLNQELSAGIAQKDTDLIKLSINLGADINKIDPQTGRSAIIRAAEAGNVEVIETLLTHGAQVSQPNSLDLDSVIHRVIKSPHELSEETQLAALIAFEKANANIDSIGVMKKTPLHCAVEKGYGSIVAYLLKNKADINKADENGNTPLHFAAMNGNESLYRQLIYKGANINATNNKHLKPSELSKQDSPLRKSINNIHEALQKSQQEKPDLLAKLYSLSVNNNLQDKENAIKDVFMRHDDPQAQYDIAQIFYQQKDWENALKWLKLAAEQNHYLSQRMLPEIDEILKKERQLKDLLNDYTEDEIRQDYLTEQLRLRDELVSISEFHPVYTACNKIRLALRNIELFDEPIEIFNSFKEIFFWTNVIEKIQDSLCFSDEEIKNVNNKLKVLMKSWKLKIQSSGSSEVFKKLLSHYTQKYGEKTKNINMFIKPNKQLWIIYDIVIPYLVNEISCLKNKIFAEKYDVNEHIEWKNIKEGLNKLHRHYSGKILPNALYIKNDARPLIHSLETGRGYLLKSALTDKLLTPKRELKVGINIVLIINGVHFKLLNHVASPGKEDAARYLGNLISGGGAPPTTLLKIINSSQSAHVYQASKTIKGIGLDYIVDRHPEYLEKLCMKNFAGMVIQGFLLRREDGKPDNCIARLIPDPDNPGQLKSMEIISIDNDIIFGAPILRKENNFSTNVKDVLYLFPHMYKPIDEEFKKHFLALNPAVVCMQWLKRLHERNQNYEELIKNKVFTLEEYSGNPAIKNDMGLNLPIRLPIGEIERIYNTLCQLQTLLRSNSQITLQILFESIEPILGKIYRKIMENYNKDAKKIHDGLHCI